MTTEQMTHVTDARLLLRWAASSLTERERSVLALVMEGHDDQQIGELLGFSRENAAQARERACRKMRERLKAAGVSRSADLLPPVPEEDATAKGYGPCPGQE